MTRSMIRSMAGGLADPAAATTASADPMFVRTARRVLFRMLGDLREGRVLVVERGSTHAFGDAEAPDDLRATLHVTDPRCWRRFLLGGSNGAAEAYMDGWFRCDDLTRLFRIFLRNVEAMDGLEESLARLTAPFVRLGHALRRNTRRGSRRNIEAHYDLGNDFFAAFLDDTMTYSCGIFERPGATMREASIAKYDRICRVLDLGAEHRLVEIGTGWGGFALHAAGTYGCRVTTTTISPRQHEEATARVRAAGLDDRVTVLRADYRDLARRHAGDFDRLVSIEMIEAVGHENLPTYFGACADLLRPGGRACIQAITMPGHRYRQYLRSVDFIRKHVFPGSCVPSIAAMTAAAARASDLRLARLDDFGPHYAETLRRWHDRFAENADAIRAMGYPERLLRMWAFYLSYCEAGFAESYTGLVHMVWTRAASGERRAVSS